MDSDSGIVIIPLNQHDAWYFLEKYSIIRKKVCLGI